MNTAQTMPKRIADIFTDIREKSDLVALALTCKQAHKWGTDISKRISWEHGQEILADAIRAYANDRCQEIYECCIFVDEKTENYFDLTDTFASGMKMYYF